MRTHDLLIMSLLPLPLEHFFLLLLAVSSNRYRYWPSRHDVETSIYLCRAKLENHWDCLTSHLINEILAQASSIAFTYLTSSNKMIFQFYSEMTSFDFRLKTARSAVLKLPTALGNNLLTIYKGKTRSPFLNDCLI